jgi:tetratricopeptide (TPR) repeat protein
MGSNDHKKWFGVIFIIFLLFTLPVPQLQKLIDEYVVSNLYFLYEYPFVSDIAEQFEKHSLFLPLTAIMLMIGVYIYRDNIKALLRFFLASESPKRRQGGELSENIPFAGEEDSRRSTSVSLKNAEAYKQDHMYDMSAEYYIQAGKKREAAQMFVMAERYFDAGKLYKELKNYEEAGNCFKKDGRYVFAAECYKMAGNQAMAAEMYRFGENFFLAGKLFLEIEQPEKAEACFLNIPEETEEYANGFESIGDYYGSQKDMKKAIKSYQRVVGGKDVNSNTIDLWYKLARIVESESGFAMAVPLYEQICAANYLYKDVASRLEKHKKPEPVVQPSPIIQQGNKRYEIIQEIGRGGMGVVYKARDTVLDRVVAYKMLAARGDHPEAINGFKREAKSVASLNHQNIISIYDFGQNEDGYFIVMEYVDGFNLRDICLENKNFIFSSFKKVFSQITDVLLMLTVKISSTGTSNP